MSDQDAADAEFAGWMRDNLRHASAHFGLRVTGQPVFGWRLRSIGARVTGPRGPRWLRVVSEPVRWACGDSWTGNVDAKALTGVSAPRVLDVWEWDDHDWRRLRAEVMTLLPGQPVSPTPELREAPTLTGSWWAHLRAELDLLRNEPTGRISIDQDAISARTRAAFGVEVRVESWETVHGDLHWANLLTPDFGLLDWELWGRGPAGIDAASLLLHSLTAPGAAARVRDVFADRLDGDAGRVAQLIAAARLLTRAAGGDFPDLVEPVRQHVHRLGVRMA